MASIGFFLFGVHSPNPFCIPKRIGAKVCSSITVIAQLICVISFTYLLQRDLLKNSQKLSKKSIAYLSLATPIIPNIVFMFETFFSKTEANDIWLKLNRTKIHVNKIINVSVQLETFRRSFRAKCVFSVAMTGVMLFIKITPLKSSILSTSFDCMTLILGICKCWAVLLVIILIDFMDFLLFSLNQQLEKLSSDEFQFVWNLINLFRHIRIIHFKLHRVTAMINKRFGWFLIALLFDMFNLINNSIFIAFTGLMEPHFREENMRNLSHFSITFRLNISVHSN